MADEEMFVVKPMGFVRSELKSRKNAPRQGRDGAPDAWIDIESSYSDCLDRLAVGSEVILLTWLHQSDRSVQKVHPRFDRENLYGVFATRSPDRPNPIGLHRVTLLAIEANRLHVLPLEAIDGTPVVDIKPVFQELGDI
jgi:tRNA-Thr(GGU) m(6)t(6)A37 methyltransferase TsaA